MRADLASAAFGKNAFVYGQIDEKGHAVRKWPARKKAITDKMIKNGRLSVKIQTFRTRFYGQITDKRSKKQLLSVNLHEILPRSVEQHCI